jgi:hypothetical protein
MSEIHPETEEMRLDARAAISSYVALCLIPAALFLGMVICSVTTASPGWGDFVLVTGIMLLSLVLWVRGFRIVVADGKLTYHTLFRKRIVALSDIRLAATETGGYHPLQPPLRFVLHLADPAVEPIIINMKPFRKEDLHWLFSILGPKMKHPPKLSIFGKD